MPNIPLDRTISRFCNSYTMIFGRRTAAVEADEQWKGEKCLNTMRQSFHRALTTCKAPLPPGKKYVAVQFLTKELIFYVVDAKGKGQEIFEEASKHLGLSDTELFGLAFYQDGDYIFIDLNLKVSKYAVRGWKTHSNGLGGDGQPLLILHMRIKYYVDCHLLISEKIVRHHYYLQLRENVKNYSQPLSEEKSFLLAALALQADLGNYDEKKHKNCYFETVNYFPSWIITKVGEDFIIRNIPALHQDNAGLSRGEAQVGYIKEASDITAPHNLHFYKMRRKKGKTWGYVWLGIRYSGLYIYELQEPEHIKSLLSTFLWCDIAKLYFEKKKFEILSEGSPECRRFTYFVQNEELAKHLLWICRTTHHFHMANQTRVADLKKLELDGGKQYRESYIYTDKVDQAREKKQNIFKCKLKSKVENGAVNFNGTEENFAIENLKPVNMKMSGMPWTGNCLDRTDGQCIAQHHSMEVLPLVNGCKFSSDIKYKSQSISCFPDRCLAPYSITADGINTDHVWCPPSSSTSTTPTSTLMSRSSCASNTDSTCSSLSLASGSTIKVGNSIASRDSSDGGRWVKCDSFEELPLQQSPAEKIQKVCISTFVDKHVRTASVYDAVTIQKPCTLRTSAEFTTVSSQSNLVYATHSLGTASSAKVSDVRRTPSLNVCNKNSSRNLYINRKVPSSIDITLPMQSVAQKPNRHYVTNSQNHGSSHGRTATRIGVSSLNRDQRLPLTLFSDRRILACGSEPNLYVTVGEHSPASLSHNNKIGRSQWLRRNTNSQSEMNLNVDHNMQSLNTCFNVTSSGAPKHNHCDTRCRQLSLPDVCSDILENDGDFPCIPPPPAYRNEIENSASYEIAMQPFSYTELPISNAETILRNGSNSQASQMLEHHKELRTAHSTPPDVLDIQQLRQRSLDLDLPLISALCNDRSLLMLPKTVPTCSRQRHLGSKDPMRFNRTTSLPNGDSNEILPPNSGRPVSWHIDSSRSPHFSSIPKPSSASWDNGIRAHVSRTPVAHTKVPIQSLPPTILTSFGKTPEKQIRNVRDQCSSSDSYRYNKSQMIPTKLLASSLMGVPNGRLYQKGSSS